jgi:ketosteroid isomerase-like protein
VHPNEALIDRFYRAFQARDAATMGACYHAEVVFSDPVFPELRGGAAGAMWAMLCARAKDLDVVFGDVRADDVRGQAHWEARYTFSPTGRHVHNVIDATFDFRDGLIVRHVDRFGFWRWARQALGATGWLLGGTPIVRNKVRSEARRGLDAFLQKQAGTAAGPQRTASR